MSPCALVHIDRLRCGIYAERYKYISCFCFFFFFRHPVRAPDFVRTFYAAVMIVVAFSSFASTLVRHGWPGDAVLEVTLYNNQHGFRYEKYGDSITVRRTIKQPSGGSFALIGHDKAVSFLFDDSAVGVSVGVAVDVAVSCGVTVLVGWLVLSVGVGLFVGLFVRSGISLMSIAGIFWREQR